MLKNHVLKKLKSTASIAIAFFICIPLAIPQNYTSNAMQDFESKRTLAQKPQMQISSVDEIDDITVEDSEKGNTYIRVADLNEQSAEDIVSQIMGDGVEINEVRYFGTSESAGTFETDDPNTIGFSNGIVLSSGNVKYIDGPNSDSGVTYENMTGGDEYLDLLIPGYTTYDSTVLEFDFTPNENTLSFEYVFSSEEYNEFVGSDYNDVFGFFLNGENIALIPDSNKAVAINNVNNGYKEDFSESEDYYDEEYAPTNPQYFRDNTDGHLNTEMDGLTTVLTAKASVNVGKVNTIRLAIADAGDEILDSNVFIKAASFTAVESDVVQFSSKGFDCSEDEGYATITVERSGNADSIVEVSYYTQSGSADSGVDYSSASGTLTFAPGVTSKTFKIQLLDDDMTEGSETVNIFLKEASGNAFIGQNIQAKLYIEDNDAQTDSPAEKTVVWDKMDEVPTNKNFVIKFNMEIDPETVTSDNFYVTDSAGDIISGINPEIAFNNLSVIMKPEGYFSYNSGSTYFLNIGSAVKTSSGKSLGQLVKMQFTTSDLTN
ncbi:Ig-like domain-containing protein [Peptoclostridium litorale DSM 5388]|uniref:Calx-beta domain-containing protein n=1 Tax=Peptoclostridium litorale DSM 5388 TaxID=1121324 RepID=A0A069RIT4_PEPLI|nr:choice-of-anchor L domain-containing protein [Peptoclostridium litorale]KDR96698.1 hypothetical protein CLIT_2c03040 [Peptoclostridium litorale DSM 5388]SIN67620.1 Ig-like domain-containing protein [Peptoclostridium litorale DSM 5388]